jgi:hypothetical protein
LPLSTGVTGTLATTNGGTGLTSFTSGGVVYASSTSALATGSALTFDGTTLTASASASTTGNFKSTSTTAQVFNVTASNDVNTTLGMGVQGSASGVIGMIGSGQPLFGTSAAELNIYNSNASGVIKFGLGTGVTEQMRLTSSGLEVKQSQLIGYSSYAGIGTNGLAVAGSVLVGHATALTNGKLQITGGIGLSGNTQIRQATNGDGNTLQVFATQFVAGGLNSTSYGYTGGGLIASVSPGDSAVLLDTGRATSTDGRFKVANTTSANTAMSLEKNGVYTLYADTGSGNLGIGTSSPGQRLEIQAPAGASQNAVIRLRATDSGSSSGCVADISAIGTGGQVSALAFSTRDGTNILERMRLDGAGNLGLGATPSAWGSSQNAAQVGNLGLMYSPASNTNSTVTHNAYYDGTNWRYITSSVAAARYEMTGANSPGSTHSWSVSAGGTAGNTISFTQAMTLDASGRLGIGVTLPTVPLQIQTASGSPWLLSKNGTDEFYFGVNASLNIPSIESNTVIRFATGASYIERARISSDGTFRVKGAGTAGSTDAFQVSGSAPADAARIDSSGNLGVGETSMGTIRLFVKKNDATSYSTSNMGAQTHTFLNNATNGGFSNLILGCVSATSGSAVYAGVAVVSEQASDTNGALAFGTRGSGGANITERARITSTGNVVAGGSVALATTATDGFLYVPTCAGTPTGVPTAITGMAPIVVNTTNNKLYFYSGGAWRDAGP